MQMQSILIKHESCQFVCPRFPKPPKVPGSWNVGSRPNLGQLKTWRSPIFEILIFKGGSPPYGLVYIYYTYETWILSVCLCVCVRVFRSHQMSQGHETSALDLIWAKLKHDEARVFLSHQKFQLHEILALGLIWANLKHDESRFSKL